MMLIDSDIIKRSIYIYVIESCFQIKIDSMILKIFNNMTISEVQNRFSLCFPTLKIEFYFKAHHPQSASSEKHLISPEKRIGDIRQNRKEGTMEIKSWDTVEKTELRFHKLFGLNVQIFRKENGSWIQTTRTDKFTLYEQNQLSLKAECQPYPSCKEQLSEYDYL
jgi:hypothetical protein